MKVTRRAVLTAGVSALLSSCLRAVPHPTATLTPAPTETPSQRFERSRPPMFPRTIRSRPVLRISVPPLPPTLDAQAQAWLRRLTDAAPTHWRIVPSREDEALLRVRPSLGERPEHAIGGRWLLPVTTHDNLIDGLSATALSALLDGTIDDWYDIGAPEHLSVQRVSLADFGYRFSRHARATVPASALPTVAEAGLIALVEPQALDPLFRVLPVERHDPLRSERSAVLAQNLIEWLVVEGELELLPEEVFRPATPVLPDLLTLTFVGDIILGRTVHRIMADRNDWTAPFRMIASETSWADLTIGNLECALSDRFTPPENPYTLRFLSSTRAVRGLTLAGIDAVSLANNHSMDFGPAALADTQQALGEAGIAWFGAGADRAEALRPAMLRLAERTIALLGFDGIAAAWYGATENQPGTAALTPEAVRSAISAATDQADIVIPFFHWGVEYTLVPTEEQRAIARIAIDSGATLVVGSHPHWVQGVEWYRGRPIFYSLGNFVFDQEWSWETKQSVILHLWFTENRLLRYELVPAVIEDYHRPRLAIGWEATVIGHRIRASSEALRSTGAALTPVP